MRIAWRTNNLFILGILDSSSLEGYFGDLNDVK